MDSTRSGAGLGSIIAPLAVEALGTRGALVALGLHPLDLGRSLLGSATGA